MHERGATGYSLSVDRGACGRVQGVGGTGVGVVTGVCRCWCPPSIGQIPPRVSPALHSLQRTGTAWGIGTPLRISLVCRLRLVAVAEVGSRSTAPPPSSYQEAEREGEGEGDDAKKKMGEQIWRKSTWICYRCWRRRRCGGVAMTTTTAVSWRRRCFSH